MAVFDLDDTLWGGSCDQWPVGTFVRYQPPAGVAAPSHRRVYDPESHAALELHPEVPLIFAALRAAGARIGIASASAAADSAHALLAAFDLGPDDLLIEMADATSRAAEGEAAEAEPLKARQLRRIAAQLGDDVAVRSGSSSTISRRMWARRGASTRARCSSTRARG